AGRIADHGPHVNDPSVLLGKARERLPELRNLALSHGVNIVLLVPPTLRPDSSQEVQALGSSLGIPVWVLTAPGEFPRDLFRDGFHLNVTGSGIFTTRLAAQIRKQVRPETCNSAEQPDLKNTASYDSAPAPGCEPEDG